jgi:hypothetical protein
VSDFLLPERPVNERATAVGLEGMDATFGQGFGAVFDDSMVRNPLPSLSRMADRLQYYPSTDEFGNETPARTPSKMLTPDEANAKYGVPGKLKFDADTPEPIAEELRALKVKELERQDTMRRAQSGLGTQLTAGLVASILDPLNVGLAFIPVVGQARFAAMAARAGVPAARAATGAIEGAAGAALLEPLVLAAATQEQADYDITDSLANVAFGGILGSGLHLAGGAVGDRLAARREASTFQRAVDDLPRADQEALARAAIAQVVEGRPVDVGPILDALRARDYYHGTSRAFSSFDNARAGSAFGGADTGDGHWFTSALQSARGYADGAATDDAFRFSESPQGSEWNRLVSEFEARAAGMSEAEQKSLWGEYAPLRDRLMAAAGFGDTPRVVRAKLEFDDPLVVDAAGRDLGEAERRAIIDQAKAAGNDAVVFRNAVDPNYAYDVGTGAADVVLMLDLAKIRVGDSLTLDQARDMERAIAAAGRADPEDAAASDTTTRRVDAERTVGGKVADETKVIEEELAYIETLTPAEARDGLATSPAEKEANTYAKAWREAAACAVRKG